MFNQQKELSHAEMLVIRAEFDWDELCEARDLMRQGYIQASVRLYRELLNESPQMARRLTGDGWPTQPEADHDLMSVGWGLVMITEYSYETSTWYRWYELFDAYLKHTLVDIGAFSDDIELAHAVIENAVDASESHQRWVSQFITSMGWALAIMHKARFTDIQQLQDAAFRRLDALTDFERGLHALLLTHIHMKLRQRDKALRYGQLALDAFPFKQEPYYYLRAWEMLASVYDYFKDLNQQYAAKAVQMYTNIIQRVSGSMTHLVPKLPYYSLGWAYLETKQFSAALTAFKRGKRIGQEYNLPYQVERNRYGIASTILNRCKARDWDEAAITLAIEELQQARQYFGLMQDYVRAQPLMMGVCLHTEAIIYQYMPAPSADDDKHNLEQALQKANYALMWVQSANALVQMHNVYRRLIHLNYRAKHWWLVLQYLVYDIMLRFQIRKYR